MFVCKGMQVLVNYVAMAHRAARMGSMLDWCIMVSKSSRMNASCWEIHTQ